LFTLLSRVSRPYGSHNAGSGYAYLGTVKRVVSRTCVAVEWEDEDGAGEAGGVPVQTSKLRVQANPCSICGSLLPKPPFHCPDCSIMYHQNCTGSQDKFLYVGAIIQVLALSTSKEASPARVLQIGAGMQEDELLVEYTSSAAPPFWAPKNLCALLPEKRGRRTKGDGHPACPKCRKVPKCGEDKEGEGGGGRKQVAKKAQPPVKAAKKAQPARIAAVTKLEKPKEPEGCEARVLGPGSRINYL
jgi:hypothetical protein